MLIARFSHGEFYLYWISLASFHKVNSEKMTTVDITVINDLVNFVFILYSNKFQWGLWEVGAVFQGFPIG